MKYFYIFFIFFQTSIFSTWLYGQGTDCSNAVPFCLEFPFAFPNNTGNTAQMGPDYGCLLTQPDPAWDYLQILNSGNLDIEISQVNISGSAIDVDFICYGPFTSLAGVCTAQLTAGNMTDCSYSTSAIETCHIPNALFGQFYLFVITNYSSTSGTISLSQTGGSASTNCNIVGTPTSIFSNNGITICSDSAILDAGSYFTFDQYLWSTGDTTKNITVHASGFYSVTATTDTLVMSDTIHVLLTSPYLNLSLGSDTLLCTTDTIKLNAGNGFSSYLWNTGSTADSINVFQTGNYSIITQDTANCFYRDTINIIMNPIQSLNLGNDTAICKNEQLTISTGSMFDSYLWSTGETTSSITVDTSGNFSVTVTSVLCSAIAADSINVFVNPLPIAEAGDNFQMCFGNPSILNGSGGLYYSWLPIQYIANEYTANPYVNPISDMNYYLTVTDSNGCRNTDSVRVFVAPAAQPDLICVASADVNFNQNVIIWQMPSSLSVDSVVLAKSSISTGNIWIPIATLSVNDPNIYYDGSSNPSTEMTNYMVVNKDTCGFDFMDSTQYRHSTMYLQASSGTNYNYLQWNNYYGYNYNCIYYVLFRGNTYMLSAIDTLAPNHNYYTDYAVNPGFIYYYRIKAIRADTCSNVYPPSYISSNSNMAVIESSGINENAFDNQFEFYPNPVDEEITISISASVITKTTQLYICDILGNKILQSFLIKEKTKINLSTLAKGIYFLKLENASGVVVRKFVKE